MTDRPYDIMKYLPQHLVTEILEYCDINGAKKLGKRSSRVKRLIKENVYFRYLHYIDEHTKTAPCYKFNKAANMKIFIEDCSGFSCEYVIKNNDLIVFRLMTKYLNVSLYVDFDIRDIFKYDRIHFLLYIMKYNRPKRITYHGLISRAVRYSAIKCLKSLVYHAPKLCKEFSKDPSYTNSDPKQNLIYLAIKRANFECAKILCEQGFSMSIYDYSATIGHDNLDFIKYLLSKGCPIDLPHCIDLAEKLDKKEILTYLKEVYQVRQHSGIPIIGF